VPSLATTVRFFLFLNYKVPGELFVQLRLVLRRDEPFIHREECKAAHGAGCMLFLVFGIAHPEQFINRPVLIAIDRVEHGLSWCEGPPVSCGNDIGNDIGCTHRIIGSKSGNIAWRAAT
jgi:hypothetical protein